ncbi:MAG TPA: hypothetical protein O0X39_08130, partial [Methanocorpusculum sp.]|nr:hypothetical protein [Methanocorpusculum sp.]
MSRAKREIPREHPEGKARRFEQAFAGDDPPEETRAYPRLPPLKQKKTARPSRHTCAAPALRQ